MAEILVKKYGGMMYGADQVSKGVLATYEKGIYVCKLSARPSGKPTEEMRSIAQNKLLHGWHEDQSRTRVNEFAGNTAEEWKDIMKFKFLVDMYLDMNIKGYAEVINPMMSGYAPEQVRMAKWGLVKNGWITTRDLSVGHFKMYLDKVEKFCMQNGIMLRTDMHLYQQAVG